MSSLLLEDLRNTQANVLVDRNGMARIADFGLAKIIDSQASTVVATSFNGKGTMRWQAPELLTTSRFEGETGDVTAKSDIYAFACLCLEASASSSSRCDERRSDEHRRFSQTKFHSRISVMEQ